MTKYEVQFLSKVNQWVSYSIITDDPQIVLDKIEFLNSRGYDARVIIYEITSEEIREYYIKKESYKCVK